MAKIEVNTFLGSSMDNFLVFSNDNYEKPMVGISFQTVGGSECWIRIKDAINEDGYDKTIKGTTDGIISDSTFKFVSGDRVANALSVMEVLRKNNIFYDIDVITSVPNVGMVVRAYLDTSTRYSITSSSNIVISGTYSSYVPKEPNKFVLLLNNGKNQITLEKYTTGDDVSFNVTAPFERLSFKDPFQVKMVGYHIDNNTVITDNITNNVVTVLPTTLPKFSDVELTDYFYCHDGQKVNFLTNNFKRFYNYGEITALSLLTDRSTTDIVKKYYTISGKFLGQDSDLIYRENNTMRVDYYFELNIATIEASTNKQVGYVEVVGLYDGVEVTNPVRYEITPKCNQNNEIFFVNELGGIDEFNFLGERVYETKIKNQTTYFKNPTRKYGLIKELEIVSQKKNQVEHHLKTTIIDSDTAIWLNELSKSKYAFLFDEDAYKSKLIRIIITEMDIDISDRENTFEVELIYQDGDNNISV